MEHFEALYPDSSRFEEIEKILGFVKEGNSDQLVSLPGVGRSNLLGLLSYNTKVRIKHLGDNQKWFHFVYLNFSEVRNKALLDTVKYIFVELLDSLRKRKKEEEYEEVSKILKESLEFNDELILFNGLKKAIDYLAIEKELTIVLLFDRFETYTSQLSRDFFANLRVLRNRAKYRFSCIFSINRPFDESIESETLADFYEFVFGHIVYLPLMDKPGLDFRIAYLEKAKGKKLDKKILAKLISLTGGHGKLTRLSTETLIENYEQVKGSIMDFLLQNKAVYGSLFEIWSSLTPSEQNSLKSGNLKDQYFSDIALVKNGKIAIPLFEEFVNKVKKPIEISFENLSDNLTSLEFHLLKFMTENPERIIKREEIVNTVWTDLKSKEGVTDQALDQLISRLRKKIEKDPNNPVHLQTIKGRGFKFIP